MKAAVVGGGVSGLVAARELALAGWSVELFEASPRPGGKIAVGALGFDVGAESLLARRPEAVDLIEALGLGEQIVHPTPAASAIWFEGVAHPIPRSLQGIPVSVEAMAGLLSPAGLDRLAAEPGLPAPAPPGDVPIGAYVAERCGEEAVDRLLEPLLGGVYAGHSRRLSFAAVNARLWARVRGGGSLLEHAAAMQPPSSATPGTDPVFAGLRGGVHTLVDALADDLRGRGVTVQSGTTVRSVERDGAGWELVTGPVPAPRTYAVDAVVCAAPARPTARMLQTAVPAAAGLLDPIPYASMAVVTLVVRGAALSGSGLLVPPGELATVKALTHSSRKWDWVAEAAQARWGDGVEVVRASIGRLGEEQLLRLDDDPLVARTLRELGDQLPAWAGAELITAQVARWGGGLPQYAVGHVEAMTELRAELARAGRIAVCGAYLDGVGIAACVASAQRAARTIEGS